MDMKNNYLPHFSAAFAEAMSEMAGLSCRAGEPCEQPGAFDSSGMVVIVGITGSRPGRVILDSSRETAWRLSEIINGESYDINDEFILYTMGELANIISGRAISNVNNMDTGLGLRLTPPGIFYGDRLQISSPKISAGLIPITTPAGDFTLSVGFEGGR